jgi:elongation factor G
VEKGIVEAMQRGPVAGYPMVDFKVELFDGSYHDVDSNEMSFKMAGILAFRNVMPNAKPVLLEPIVEVEAWTPEEYLGAVMGDLSSRRAQILGTEQDGRMTKIRAHVPEAELDRYATQLHSITHGRGTYRQKFHAYQEVPPEVAQKVVEARARERAEAEKAG